MAMLLEAYLQIEGTHTSGITGGQAQVHPHSELEGGCAGGATGRPRPSWPRQEAHIPPSAHERPLTDSRGCPCVL